jgi:protein-disulfide isomerase
LNDPASPVAGKRDGVTLIEFFDYRCGYCKKVDPIVTELLAQNPTVRVVYKVFPILGAESLTAAKAGLAANKQGAYEQFHKALIAARESITMDFLEKIAGEVGLDFARLKADMASPEVEKEISDNMKLAQALNIQATPTFIAGSELIRGAVDAVQLRALVVKAEAARKAVDPGTDQ